MVKPRKTAENAERGAALRAVRRSRSLTQRQVAQRIGVAETTYAQLEQGYVAVTPLKVPGLAQALGVSALDLAAALRLEGLSAERLAYAVDASGAMLRESGAPYRDELRDALAPMLSPEAADSVAGIVQDIVALRDEDQAFVLEAMTDLLAGRRLRGRRPRS